MEKLVDQVTNSSFPNTWKYFPLLFDTFTLHYSHKMSKTCKNGKSQVKCSSFLSSFVRKERMLRAKIIGQEDVLQSQTDIDSLDTDSFRLFSFDSTLSLSLSFFLFSLSHSRIRVLYADDVDGFIDLRIQKTTELLRTLCVSHDLKWLTHSLMLFTFWFLPLYV